jgi:hypothetical protein
MASSATVNVPKEFVALVESIADDFDRRWRDANTKGRAGVAAVLRRQWDEFRSFVHKLADIVSGRVHPAEYLTRIGTTPDDVVVYKFAVGKWHVGFVEDPDSDAWTLVYDEAFWSSVTKR